MSASEGEGFEVEDQKQALKWNLLILTIFGYWPPETYDQEKLKRYGWYTVVMVGLTLFVYTVLEIIALFLLTNSMEDVISSSFLLLTHLVQWVKFFCFFNNRIRIISLMNNLNQKEFLPQNNTQKDLLVYQVKNGKKNFYLFFVLATSTVSLWLIFPFVESNGKVELPIKAWFPFDIHYTPVFEIIYFYQAVALMVTAHTDVCMVTLVGIFMASVCGQLDILNCKLQRLGAEITDKSVKIRKETKDIIMHSPDGELIECVQHHLKIVE